MRGLSKKGNEVKDLLPQSRGTRRINDKMQQRLVKSLFSQSFLREIDDKIHQAKYNIIICCSQSRTKSQIKRRKNKKNLLFSISTIQLSLILTVKKIGQNCKKWLSIAIFGHSATSIVKQNGYKKGDFGNEVPINQLDD